MRDPDWVPLPIGAIDLMETLRPLAFLAGDPTARLTPGAFVRATATPDGPGLIEVHWGSDDTRTSGDASWRERQAWVRVSGPGGRWLVERAPRLLGCADSLDGFDPISEPMRTLWRRHRGLRLTRTATLWHDLACFIVQQRISGRDAADQWRRLVRGLGTPMPGTHPMPTVTPDALPTVSPGATPTVTSGAMPTVIPGAMPSVTPGAVPAGRKPGADVPPARRPHDRGAQPLIAPPDPRLVARLTYADLHKYGIERSRASTLIRAAREVIRVEAAVEEDPQFVLTALGMVPGIGPWTLTSLEALTWAAADTVVVGDYGLPRRIAFALVGEREADDARMIDLLEPFRPYRAVAARLLQTAPGPPRRSPRGRRMDIRRK